MPYFSVIIPLFNKENYILQTVKSVLAQTFQDFEIIIIDDCSTDKSLEKVHLIDSDKLKIINHEKNKGLSVSRNTGIKNATAQYVAFLDADDLWKETFLEEIYTLIKCFPQAKLFSTNYEEVYPNKTILLPENHSNKIKKNTLISDFFEISLAQPLYFPSSLCVEKTVFDRIGFYDEIITFGEDVDFNIRANSVFRLAYSNKPLVSYFISSENQITHSKLQDRTITNFDSYETLALKDPSIKKYLDFNRYVMAKQYKLEKDWKNFNKMKRGINSDPKISGLNYTQRFILNSPVFLLKIIKKIKSIFVQKGIRFTTYS